MTDGGVGIAAGMVVIEPRLPLRRVEQRVIEPGGLPIGLKNPQAHSRRRVVHLVLRHRHPRPVGQEFDGVEIVEIFDFFDEGDDVSARAAAEAVKGRGFGIEIERGGLFPMKGAKPHEIAPPPFETDIRGNDALDVAAVQQLLQKRLRQRHPITSAHAPGRGRSRGMGYTGKKHRITGILAQKRTIYVKPSAFTSQLRGINRA